MKNLLPIMIATTLALNASTAYAIKNTSACGFNFDQVVLTVKQVRLNISATANGNDSGWQTISLVPAQQINLLSTTNTVFNTLGQAPLPAGTYQQIRLVLVPGENFIVINTSDETQITVPLITPSATESGYKIQGSFTVQPNTLYDLTLNFNVCQSIIQQGNGAYLLKPVVTATPVEVIP